MIFERNGVKVEIEDTLVEKLAAKGIDVKAEMLEGLAEEFGPIEDMTIADVPVKTTIIFEVK